MLDRARLRRALPVLLPSVALAVMLAVIFAMQPSAMSYFGFTLLFKMAPPLILAALAQMLIILQGEIDLSNGAFVGLVTCIAAIFLGDGVAAGLLVLAGLILAGLITSGDPNVAPSCTLLGIGAVIPGGGIFVGGHVSALGTVIGALTLSLAGSFLRFLQVPST